jgi:hypothetical protein
MRTAVATAALLLVLAAPASAAPTRLGTSETVPVVDASAGRVAWQPDAASIRVFDLGSGTPARTLAIPAGCRSGDPGALRGDRLVLACPDGSRLLDVASGAVGPVPGAGAAGIGGPDSGVLTAGRFWAEGWDRDATVFFRLDGSAVDRGEGTAAQLPDLDAPTLWRPLCPPLQRTRAERDEEPDRTYLPYAYSPPLGLEHRAFDYRALRVERCGHERPLRLSRCRRACVAVQLGAGSIAWRERGRIRLFRGASRRRAHWRARRFGREAQPFPTRDHVIVAAGRYRAYSVWSVRAPRGPS